MSTSWLVVFDFFILYLLYRLYFYPKWKHISNERRILNTIFYVYIVIVIYLTLMPVITSLPYILDHEYVSMFLIPFDDYFQSNGNALFQIVINVLMFVPFGFMLPMVKKNNFLTVTLISLLFTLTIEIIQPLLNAYRISDITDVITNTLGGAIGYLLYLLCRNILNRTVLKNDKV